MDNKTHFEVIHRLLKDSSPNFNEDTETITLFTDNIEEFQQINITTTIIPQGIEFSINQFDYLLFFDVEHFRKNWKKFINNDKDVAILNIDSSALFYLNSERKTFVDFLEQTNHFFDNAIVYSNFINFFIEKSRDENNKFQFVDSFDTNNRKLFFTSSKDPGKLVIGYPLELVELDDKINYSIILKRLKDSFDPSSKNLPIFIKNEIFRFFEDRFDLNGFVKLFKDLNKVLDNAEKNYQIYLHDLSLDKIKSDYKEYKQKYFASQNDILNKITTQVIALPISIAASAYSLYNLKGEVFPTMIVLFGLLSYIIYVTFIVGIYFSDIDNLNILAQRDYSLLKIHPFFKDNNEELKFFKEIKDKLFNRLKSLKRGLNIFTLIMWISILSLFYYGLKLLSIKINNPILPFIIIVSVFAIIYVNVLNNNELKNE